MRTGQPTALLARRLGADRLLMLIEVGADYHERGTPDQRAIRRAAARHLRDQDFAAGFRGTKVKAVCDFVEATGGVAGIGALDQALAFLQAQAGSDHRRGCPAGA